MSVLYSPGTIRAGYPCACDSCGQPIAAGQEIGLSPDCLPICLPCAHHYAEEEQ